MQATIRTLGITPPRWRIMLGGAIVGLGLSVPLSIHFQMVGHDAGRALVLFMLLTSVLAAMTITTFARQHRFRHLDAAASAYSTGAAIASLACVALFYVHVHFLLGLPAGVLVYIGGALIYSGARALWPSGAPTP